MSTESLNPRPDEPDVQMAGTAEGLIVFLNWASRWGALTSNTAAAYRTAVTQILEIDGEAWASTDMRTLDLDRQLDRFTRLRGSRYNPSSLRTYRNRASAAVSHYLRYLDNPATFKAEPSRRATGSTKAVRRAPAPDLKGPREAGSQGPNPRSSERASAPDLVQYPFPLRADLLAYLSLPRDLRGSEADRIATFVKSLAIDLVPEVPNAPEDQRRP